MYDIHDIHFPDQQFKFPDISKLLATLIESRILYPVDTTEVTRSFIDSRYRLFGHVTLKWVKYKTWMYASCKDDQWSYAQLWTHLFEVRGNFINMLWIN